MTSDCAALWCVTQKRNGKLEIDIKVNLFCCEISEYDVSQILPKDLIFGTLSLMIILP